MIKTINSVAKKKRKSNKKKVPITILTYKQKKEHETTFPNSGQTFELSTFRKEIKVKIEQKKTRMLLRESTKKMLKENETRINEIFVGVVE
jgi:hypothetical protein